MPSVFGVKRCSAVFWTSFACFLTLCLIATWLLARDVMEVEAEKVQLNWPFAPDDVHWTYCQAVEYSCCGLLAGILSAMFGIGGGIVLTPLLAQLGLLPVVVSSTGGLFVLLTTAASTALLLCEGYLVWPYAALMGPVSLIAGIASVCFVASLLKNTDKSYIIIFVLAGFVLVSALSIPAVGFYREYKHYGTLLISELWLPHNYCR